MSVMTTVEAVPARIAAVARLVAELGAVDRTVAAALLRPTDTSQMVRRVISEAVALGLVRVDGEQLLLGDDLTPAKVNSIDALWSHCHGHLVEHASASDAEQNQFPRALAWFLTRSPGDTLGFNINWSNLVKDECGGQDFDFSSDARCSQFAYWAKWLGYATFDTDGRTTMVVPDPTAVLRRLLSSTLGPGRLEPIRDVVRHLALRSPVLEGGSIRTEVEAMLPRQRPQDSLSTATSFALLRLQHAGVLELIREADSPVTVQFSLIDGARQPFSHLRLVSREQLQ